MKSVNPSYHVDTYPNLIYTREQLTELQSNNEDLIHVHGTNTSFDPQAIERLGVTPADGMSQTDYGNAIRQRGRSRDDLIKTLLNQGRNVFSTGIHRETHGISWDPSIHPKLREDAMDYAKIRISGIHSDVLGIPTITDTYQMLARSILDGNQAIVYFSGDRDHNGNPLYNPTGQLTIIEDPRTQIELSEALRVGSTERRKLMEYVRKLSQEVSNIHLADTTDKVLEILGTK